jgi:5-formyltetrahydrofolate cyclo-ligase
VHLATDTTEIHQFGFLQPKENSGIVELDKITVSLVPGIAFDEFGNRLGHGSGYYDQLLPKLNPSCLMIGVTTEDLIFEQLPSESHDIPMTHLVTELGLRQTKNC